MFIKQGEPEKILKIYKEEEVQRELEEVARRAREQREEMKASTSEK